VRPARRPRAVAPAVIVAQAELPSRFGKFRIVAFAPDAAGKEHVALVRGEVKGAAGVPLRIHSECLTGDALGSLRCDCRDQLERSLQAIGALPTGVVLYLRQEGRGIGLANKVRAYALQDQGADTIDANHRLGFGADLRDYAVAAAMLDALGVQSVRLMTNNPAKLDGLRRHGARVLERIPLLSPATPDNEGYLRTKQERAGHLLGLL
jgi:GTP cyclohydrolase II